jgi:DnaJ-domain-containing protein 1
MGIIDRLSDVIRSYLSEDNVSATRMRGVDQDFADAYEELDEFLREGRNAGTRSAHSSAPPPKTPLIPEVLRQDFTELGVPFGANAEACKTAYKKLLKIHHPDRHAGHSENMRKATEKSARINAAYERIERWRTTGTV